MPRSLEAQSQQEILRQIKQDVTKTDLCGFIADFCGYSSTDTTQKLVCNTYTPDSFDASMNCEQHLQWKAGTREEYDNMSDNKSWTLERRKPGTVTIKTRLVWKVKLTKMAALYGTRYVQSVRGSPRR